MDIVAMIHAVIGDDTQGISFAQMLARAVIVFFIGLILVRITTPRIFNQATAVDIVLSVIIGSNLSRTLTGNAPFFEVIAATALLVFLHAIITRWASHWRPLATLVKGRPVVLVRDGVIDWTSMHASAVGKRDLEASIRSAGGTEVDDVKLATLERGGAIEVILHD